MSRRNAVDETADRLRDAILRRELPAGQDLPGERELAERLGVSRLTLRSALARLAAEGLVRPVHGSGTRVLDFRETGGVDLIGYLARQSLEGGTVPSSLLADLLELRRMVAVEMLGLVAERATPGEIAALRAQRRKQGSLVDDPEAFVRADLDFARMMLRASHNLALELLFNTIQRIIEQNPGFEAAFLVNADASLTVYDKLLDLIEERNPKRVRKTTRRLLERLDRGTLERVDALGEALARPAGLPTGTASVETGSARASDPSGLFGETKRRAGRREEES